MIESTVVRKLKVLVLDTECRPMHYSEWREEAQITASAWSFVGRKHIETRVLEQDLSNEVEMMSDLLGVIAEADMLCGHYIKRHDLPLINDHCIRLGFTPVTDVLVQDTKSDLIKVKALGLSQENLALEFRLTNAKHHMAGALWRRANTLTPEGQKQARIRVTSDVQQNKELRLELIRRGMLGPPSVWQA
jgi:DNA polymerase elongation subunit (family B)